MNRSQRRLHSYRRRPALGEVPTAPTLARGATPVADGAQARFSIERDGFSATISIPARPAGWVILAEGETELPAPGPDYAAVRVDRPPGGNWSDALTWAARWLRTLPEARGLPVALAGTGDGREAALAAAAALGPRVAALILDAEASDQIVITPTLIAAAGDEDRIAAFLDAELGRAPSCALNHRRRRLLSRRLERRLRRDCRRRGTLSARVRAGVATLATALAFTLALGLAPQPASAAVSTNWDSLTLQLTVLSDGASDSIDLTCDTLPGYVELNGSTLPGDAVGLDDPVMECPEVTSLFVDGVGGNDTIDLSGVSGADFVNLGGGDVTAQGGAGTDSVTGTDVRDLLEGEATGDTLLGGGENDSMRGGLGDDSMNGQGASDTGDFSTSDTAVTVDLSADSATGEGTDTLFAENAIGSDEADSLTASGAIASLTGGVGADTLTGGAGGDTLSGGSDPDTLDALAGADSLLGDAGADRLDGGTAGDTVAGGTEDDTLLGGDASLDTLDGGSGTADMADYSGAGAGIDLDLDGVQTIGGAEADSIVGFEQAQGTASPDTLLGSTTAADTLLGGAGGDVIDGWHFSDSLAGQGGGDDLNGLFGADTLLGGTADDTLQGDQDSVLGGGGSNDTLDGGTDGALGDLLTHELAANNPNGNIVVSDTQVSGSGTDSLIEIDRASLEGNDNDNVVAASAGFQPGGEFSGDVTIDGAGGDDTVRGGLGDDSLSGGPGTNRVEQASAGDQTLTTSQLTGVGTDTLSGVGEASLRADLSQDDQLLDASGFTGPVTMFGGTGIDTLRGGAADDLLEPGNPEGSVPVPDPDTVDGNGGGDTIDYGSATGPLDIDLGADTVNAADGDDWATLEEVENATGTESSTGVDTLVGDGSANVLDGNRGADTLAGAAGDDSLIGGPAGDTLDLDDTLQGGADDDTLSGGDGINTADYSDDPGGVGINANLATGQVLNASTDTVSGIRNLVGTSFGDTLTGDGAANTLNGAAGNDALNSQDAGVADRNECGADTDIANADTQDTNVDCETVNTGGGGGPPGGGGGGGGGGNAPPVDTTAPVLELSGKKTQKSKSKIKVDATSGEASTVDAGGTIKVPKGGKKKKLALGETTAELQAGDTVTLTLKIKGKAKKLVKGALKSGKKSTATVEATAADGAGNQGADELRVKVKKKRK